MHDRPLDIYLLLYYFIPERGLNHYYFVGLQCNKAIKQEGGGVMMFFCLLKVYKGRIIPISNKVFNA